MFDINCIIAGKFVRYGNCAYCVFMWRSKLLDENFDKLTLRLLMSYVYIWSTHS